MISSYRCFYCRNVFNDCEVSFLNENDMTYPVCPSCIQGGEKYDVEVDKKTNMKYEITQKQQQMLDKWHYTKPSISQPERFQMINNATRELAKLIMENTPEGRHQSLSLTHLEDVRMRANAAIVLDEE